MMVAVSAVCILFLHSWTKAQQTDILAIPAEMSPNAVIIYDKDLNMHQVDIQEESFADKGSNSLPPDRGDTSGLAEEEKMVAQIRKEAENLPQYYIREEYLPTPNTMVIYGSDGILNRIVPMSEEEIESYLSAQ